MVVSMISDIQPHLGSGSALNHRGTAAMPKTLSSRLESDSIRVPGIDSKWGQAQQARSSSNAAAGRLRSMDTQLQAVAHHIQRMSEDSRSFRKNFPPFPQGSEERERVLNSFQAIRRQIEQLTIPPPREKMAQVSPDEKGALTDRASQLLQGFEALLQSIGTRIPDVPDGSSAAAFKALQEQLESLLAFISDKRAELVQAAAPKKYYKGEEEGAVSLDVASISITMGQVFSEEPDWQMTVSRTTLKAFTV